MPRRRQPDQSKAPGPPCDITGCPRTCEMVYAGGNGTGRRPSWKPKTNIGRLVCATCARYYYRRGVWPEIGPSGCARQTALTSARVMGACRRQLAEMPAAVRAGLEALALEQEMAVEELWREARMLYRLKWGATPGQCARAAQNYLDGVDPDDV